MADVQTSHLVPPTGSRRPTTRRVVWILLRHGHFRRAVSFAAKIAEIRFDYWFRPKRGHREALRIVDNILKAQRNSKRLNEL